MFWKDKKKKEKDVINSLIILQANEIKKGDKVWWSGIGVGCEAMVLSEPFVENNGLSSPKLVVLIKRKGYFNDKITTSPFSLKKL